MPEPTLAAAEAARQLAPGFTASFGFQVLFMAVLTFVSLVCSFRVNVVFVLLSLGGKIAFSFLTAALFVGSDALRLVGAGMAMQTAGEMAGAALLLAG